MKDKWEIWHDFDRAVKWTLLEPIHCPNDGFALSLQGNDEFEPVLYCWHCHGTIEPGVRVTRQVQELVESLH